MRIEKPRSPRLVEANGRMVPSVGYAQMLALDVLALMGRAEAPPKDLITATGILREHIFNDLIPLKMARAEVRQPGITDYYLTPEGRFAREHGVVADPPRKQRASLMEARKKVDRLLRAARRNRRRSAERAAA